MEKPKKPYKVVMEPVLEEKKKLRTKVSYNIEAPSGYTYVPIGIPGLTRSCKEMSRKNGLRVYIVSEECRHKYQLNPDKLAYHVNRVGHHFQNSVVERAFQWELEGSKYTQKASRRGTVQSTTLAQKLDAHGQRLGLHLGSGDREMEKTLQTRQVRDTVRELFPFIPKEDLEMIVTRAFEQGEGRVGNAIHLPLSKKVQLAVNAHIRHRYTKYDQVIKDVGWADARRDVEKDCLSMIVKWRGENEGDPGITELEEMFREVIVIEDSSSEADDNNNNTDHDYDFEDSDEEYEPPDIPLANQVAHNTAINREPSLEIVSVHEPNSEHVKLKTAPIAIPAIAAENTALHSGLVHVQPRRAIARPPLFEFSGADRQQKDETSFTSHLAPSNPKAPNQQSALSGGTFPLTHEDQLLRRMSETSIQNHASLGPSFHSRYQNLDVDSIRSSNSMRAYPAQHLQANALENLPLRPSPQKRPLEYDADAGPSQTLNRIIKAPRRSAYRELENDSVKPGSSM